MRVKGKGMMRSSTAISTRIDSNKRIRADDDDDDDKVKLLEVSFHDDHKAIVKVDNDQQMIMIHELESGVLKIQSMFNDMPKTCLEIALMKLSDYQKGEMEKLQTELDELEKQVEDKNEVEKLQSSEVEKLQAKVALLEKQADDKNDEIKRLSEGAKVMKSKLACYLRFCCNRDKRQKETIDGLTKSLNEKAEYIDSLEDLNKVLTVNEHRYNDELQQARKVLVRGIEESTVTRSIIGVKRMGELDSRPFGNALRGMCSSSSAELVSNQSVLLCNFWEQMLMDQAWHPFKITLVDGKHKESIDANDKLLKGLKNEWGEKAYSAVVNALMEINQYNASGRNPVQELWNFKENRRATVMEGVVTLVRRLRKFRTPNTSNTFTK